MLNVFLDSFLDSFKKSPEHVSFRDVHENLPESLVRVSRCDTPTNEDLQRVHQFNQTFRKRSVNLGARDMMEKHAIPMERVSFSKDETASTLAKTRKCGMAITPVCLSAMVQAIRPLADCGLQHYITRKNWSSETSVSCRRSVSAWQRCRVLSLQRKAFGS